MPGKASSLAAFRELLCHRMSVTELTDAPNRGVQESAVACGEYPGDRAQINRHRVQSSQEDDGSLTSQSDGDGMHFHLPTADRSTVPTPYSIASRRQPSEETVTIFLDDAPRRTVAGTTTVVVTGPPAFSPEHPVILNNPPPFNRHSEPPSQRQGRLQQHDMRRRDSATNLRLQLVAVDDEREKFAQRLEAVTQELAAAHELLNQTNQELVVRQEMIEQSRQVVTLSKDRCRHIEVELASTQAQFRNLREVFGRWSEQNRSQHIRPPKVSPWSFGYWRRLKQKIFDLEQALTESVSHVDSQCSIAFEAYQRWCDATAELERVQQQRDGALAELDAQQQQLEDCRARLVDQTNADEDLQLAQQEAYELHRRMHGKDVEMRKLQDELEHKKMELAVVKQWGQDQVHEIRCLRHRLADRRDIRWTA